MSLRHVTERNDKVTYMNRFSRYTEMFFISSSRHSLLTLKEIFSVRRLHTIFSTKTRSNSFFLIYLSKNAKIRKKETQISRLSQPLSS